MISKTFYASLLFCWLVIVPNQNLVAQLPPNPCTANWINLSNNTWNNSLAVEGDQLAIGLHAQYFGLFTQQSLIGATYSSPLTSANTSLIPPLTYNFMLPAIAEIECGVSSVTINTSRVYSGGSCSSSIGISVRPADLSISSISPISPDVCLGEEVEYTVTPTNSSHDILYYFWDPTGGTVISGQGTNKATIKWITPGSGMGVVKVTPQRNSCDGNFKEQLGINVSQPPVFTFNVTEVGASSPAPVEGVKHWVCGKTFQDISFTWSGTVFIQNTQKWVTPFKIDEVVTGGTLIPANEAVTEVDVDKWASSGNVDLYADVPCFNGPVTYGTDDIDDPQNPLNPEEIHVDPYPSPIEHIDGPTTVCEEAVVDYGIDAIVDADLYEWQILNSSGLDVTTTGNGLDFDLKTGMANLSFRIEWLVAGSYTVKAIAKQDPLQDFGNLTNTPSGCNGTSTRELDVIVYSATNSPIETISYSGSGVINDVVLNGDPELNVDHCGKLKDCVEKKYTNAFIEVSLNANKGNSEFKFGDDMFDAQIEFDLVITDINSTTLNISGATGLKTISLVGDPNSTTVSEGVLRIPLTHHEYASIASVTMENYSFSSSTLPSYIENELELIFRIHADEEYDLSYHSNSFVNLISATTIGTHDRVKFDWANSSMCYDFKNFQIQILKLAETDEATASNMTTDKIKVDWSKALTLETNSSNTNLELFLGEGSGYYIWRVRPISDFYDGGIANSENQGQWSNYGPYEDAYSTTITTPNTPYLFYFNQTEDKNWIYSRTFSEGGAAEDEDLKISESMTYANGLKQVKQQQKKIASSNQVVVTQTVHDYSGRPVLQTLPVPIGSKEELDFVPELVTNQSGMPYSSSDFDADANFNDPLKVYVGNVTSSNPTNYFNYYSDENLTDPTIPDAEEYPFTRSLYYNGYSDRVKESSGPGNTFRIKPNPLSNDSRTTKTYYDAVTDEELIRIFGEEAPNSSTVTKVITTDPDKVTTASYISKEGKTLATFLIRTGKNDLIEANPVKRPLPTQATSGFSSSKIVPVTSKLKYGLEKTWEKTFSKIPTTTVQIYYTLSPETIEDICTNFCKSCDYEIEIEVVDVEEPSVKIFSHYKKFEPEDCNAVSNYTMPTASVTLKVGTYAFKQKIVANLKDNSNSTISTSYRQNHTRQVKDDYEAMINAQIAPFIQQLDNQDLEGFYTSLGINPAQPNADQIYRGQTVPFAIGCETIELPIDLCPKDDCDDPDFIQYFLDTWPNESFSNVDASGKLIFTSTIPSKRYTVGELNDMFDNMINGTMCGITYDCEDIWTAWKSLTLNYKKLDNMASPANFVGNYQFDMMKSLLDDLGRTIVGFSNVAFDVNGGYLSHAYCIMEYDLNNRQPQCEELICGPGSQFNTLTGVCPAILTFEKPNSQALTSDEWTNFYYCVNGYDPNNSPPDPNDFKGDIEAECKRRCEVKSKGFREALILSIHNFGMYVEGDPHEIYLLDPKYYSGGREFAFDRTKPFSGPYDYTNAELDCMVDELVSWCKSECVLTLQYDANGILQKTGTDAEILQLQKIMTYAWEIYPSMDKNSCDCPTVDDDHDDFTCFLDQSGAPSSSTTGNMSNFVDYRYGGGENDFLYDLIETSDGGMLAVGWSESFESTPGEKTHQNITSNSREYWIVKIDKFGTKEYDLGINANDDDELVSVLEVSDGYILAGSSKSTIDPNPLLNKTALNRGKFDYWVMKIAKSPTLNIMWQQTYGGSDEDVLFQIVKDKYGGFLLGGASLSGVSGNKTASNFGAEDFWLVKIDDLGVKQWDKSYGGSDLDIMTSLKQHPYTGEIVLAGYTTSNANLIGSKTTGVHNPNQNVTDFWIVYLDQFGNHLWDKNYGGDYDDILTDVQFDSDDLILSGFAIHDNLGSYPDGDHNHQPRNAGNDGWIIKVDGKNSGQIIWERNIGGEGDDQDLDQNFTVPFTSSSANTIAMFTNVSCVVQTDGSYVIGLTSESNDQNGWAGITDKSETYKGNTNEIADFWFVKLDKTGQTIVWDKTIGGEGNDILKVLRKTKGGSFIAGGYSNSPVGFDKSQPAVGGSAPYKYDYWIVKFDMDRPDCYFPAFCFRFKPFPPYPIEHVHVFERYTCEKIAADALKDKIYHHMNKYVKDQVAALDAQYVKNCMDPNMIDDEFRIEFPQALHHYTLYYYDRAGNLIRTVSPQGTKYAANLQDRTTANTPDHTYVTTYKYNSVKQLIEQNTPDGGSTKYYYDDAGRLRFSQNAQQLVDGTYSYSKYDQHSRIIETGLSNKNASAQDLANPANANNVDHPANAVLPATPTIYNTEVVHTVYGAAGNQIQYLGGFNSPQRFTTNRISHSYTDEDGDKNTIEDNIHTYYSYDPHGNVEWLCQSLPSLSNFYIAYEYDLISGNVLKVKYNEGKLDEFYHRYSYDEDNRIVKVETSRDDLIWDEDANYEYYAHGPLKRTEIGDDDIQGLDYLYTLQGWLKSMNHQSLITANDLGQDGEGTSTFASDVYAMQLNYFKNDFKRSGSQFNYNHGSNMPIDGNRNLYSGNISNWSTNTDTEGNDFVYNGLHGFQYYYDEVNRIGEAIHKYHSGKWNSNGIQGDYYSHYDYDGNGNLMTLNRNGYTSSPSGLQMDDFNYTYENYGSPTETNKLLQVADGVSASNYTVDVDNQGANNYEYDAIGNLIRDDAENIATIAWTNNGKVKHIERAVPGGAEDLDFMYDAMGNRVSKIVKPAGGSGTQDHTESHYVRDAAGNTMAVYEKVYNGDTGEYELKLKEQPIYGSSRLGNSDLGQDLLADASYNMSNPIPEKASNIHYRVLTKKKYEMVDHLGNVRAVVSDRKKNLDADNPVVLQDKYKNTLNGFYELDGGEMSFLPKNEHLHLAGIIDEGGLAYDIAATSGKTYKVNYELKTGNNPILKVLAYGTYPKPGQSHMYDAVGPTNNYSMFVNFPNGKIDMNFVRADNSAGQADFVIDEFEIIEYDNVSGRQQQSLDPNDWSSNLAGTAIATVGNSLQITAPSNSHEAAIYTLTGLTIGKVYTLYGYYDIDISSVDFPYSVYIGSWASAIGMLGEDQGYFAYPFEATASSHDVKFGSNHSSTNVLKIQDLYYVENGSPTTIHYDDFSTIEGWEVNRDVPEVRLNNIGGKDGLEFVGPFVPEEWIARKTTQVKTNTDYTLSGDGKTDVGECEININTPITGASAIKDNFGQMSSITKNTGSNTSVITELLDVGEGQNSVFLTDLKLEEVKENEYLAEVLTAQDYYPFGMQLPGHSVSSGDYRYGFNGMERDDEIKGSGNSQDFGARIYDNRIGRFLSLDPRIAEFPFMSPFCFAANSPIKYIDEDGEGPTYAILKAMASATRSTVIASTSTTVGAGAIASYGEGMAVDKQGNVALINIMGGMGSSESRGRGPSYHMGFTFQFSAEATVLPGVSNITQLLGNGGLFSGGVAIPETPFSVNAGGAAGADGDIDGVMLGVGLGPSAGFSYQNTSTKGTLMTGGNFETISLVADNAWSDAYANTQDWNNGQSVGFWSVTGSEMVMNAVDGMDGVYEATIVSDYHFSSFGEANETKTSTSKGTGVYFTKDKKGNFESTDLQKGE